MTASELKTNQRHHAITLIIETNKRVRKQRVIDWVDKHLPNLPALENTDAGDLGDGYKVTELLIKVRQDD